MDFLKNSPRFSFLYDGKPHTESLLEATQTENGDSLITVYRFAKGLTLTSIAKKIGKHGAYEWVNVLENTSDEPTGQISELFDADFTLPLPHEEPYRFSAYYPDPETATKIYAPCGSNWTTDEFACDVDKIVENRRVNHIYPNEEKSFSTSSGRSSEGHAPFFNIHKENAGIIFAIGWSGSWQCKINRGTDDVRIRTGLEKVDFYLKPGEKYRSSSIVVLPYTGTVTESQNKWRRLVKECYSQIGSAGRDTLAPFCANVWGGMRTASVLKRIETIKKYKLPYEYLWMDAGWYGKGTLPTPNEFEGDWSLRTGDWSVSRDIHPKGLVDVSEAAHAAGMKFLLWFEPERARVESAWFKEHPEYFYDRGKDGYGHLLLKLGDKAAWQACHDMLYEHIKTLQIDCLRIDFNTWPKPFWVDFEEENRVGMNEIAYINGLYRLWDALLEEFPHLIIDDCASGGRRIDIEMLRRSVPLWRSDYQCPANYDDYASQCHTLSFNNWMPYSGTGCGRIYDLYRIRSSYGASLATNFTFAEDESFGDDPEKMEFLRKTYAEYLKARPYFSEDFYPLTEVSDKTDVWCAWQFDRPDGKDGLVQVFRRDTSPYTAASFDLGGIDENAVYTFTDSDTNEAFEISGGTLAKNGFCVTLSEKRASKVYFYTHS